MPIATPVTISGAGPRVRGGPVPAVVSGAMTLGDVGASGGLASSAAPGATIATLAVESTGSAGTYPYSATVLPLRGQVPSGYALESADDSTLRGSILSTWDDGSAAAVVVAGSVAVTAGGAASVPLRAGTPAAGTAKTAAAISALVTSVAVDFGGTYGVAQITDFSTPERVWWANANTICARYRVAAPAPGSTALEAVIDIHAWTGRALVEVVVENGKLNAAAANRFSNPAAATYTGATVSINGATVATANATGITSETGHNGFRAWYARGWVGGDPGLRVTQAVSDLQQHPLLFATARTSTADFTGYAADTYAPWTVGRHRGQGMSAGGDHASIGPLPQWEVHALQSGDHRAWNAAEVSALAVLSFNVNYRDSTTGLVPTASALVNKTQTGGSANWPVQANGGDYVMWETAHHPAAGLVAFIGRPSPVFIEIAQKIAVYNATFSAESTNLGGWGAGWPDTDYTGVFGNAYQMRGRAWGVRSLVHATFLTPDGQAWKTGGRYWLARNALYLSKWTTDSKATLKFFWDAAPQDVVDAESGDAGFQVKLWQHHYLTTELHKAASARLLTGSDQTTLAAVADWACAQPVEWVNQQPDGGWRYIPYETTAGRNASTIDSAATWALQMAWRYGADVSSGASGPLLTSDVAVPSTHAQFDKAGAGGADYRSYWWAALVAAVERGVSGASTAWSTVQANATNLTTFLDGGATDPRWISTPRSGIAPAWAASISYLELKEIPGQTQKDFAAFAEAQMPGTYPSGAATVYFRNVIEKFSDGDYDRISKKYHHAGGGHLDSPCDGLFEWDPWALTWRVVVPATKWDKMPASYKAGTTFTNVVEYPNTSAKGLFFQTAATLAVADAALAADRESGVSRHTYGAMTSHAGKVHLNSRSVARCDVASGTWDRVRMIGTPGTPGGQNWYPLNLSNPYGPQILANSWGYTNADLGPGTLCTTDPLTGLIYCTLVPGDAGDSYRSSVIEINTETQTVLRKIQCFTSWGAKIGTDASNILVVGCVNNRPDLATEYPDQVGAYGTGVYNSLMIADKATNTSNWTPLVGDLCSYFPNDPACEQVPGCFDGRYFWLWPYFTDPGHIYRVDTQGVTKGQSVKLALTTTGTLPTVTYKYKLHYIPEAKAVFFFPTASSGAWAIRIKE